MARIFAYPFLLILFAGLWLTLAVLIKAANIAPFESWATWLISFGLTLTGAYWLMKQSQIMRAYEIRLKKFAVVNDFIYEDKASRDDQTSSDKKGAQKPIERIYRDTAIKKYDTHIVKGEYEGRPFKLGIHVVEYEGGERTATRCVAFLRVKVGKERMRRIVLKSGPAIPAFSLSRLTPEQGEGEFYERFQVYVLESDKNWKKIITTEIQKALLPLDPQIDIELEGAFINFYQKNRFNLEDIPELCKVARLF